jgi:CDP-diacylglycerol--glycerol-3-phosphate 3-phosphatidyltransferase
VKINPANQLTLARLILIPFFLSCVVSENFYARIGALVLFVAASLTDLYDGRVARRYNIVTTVGTFLDPLADKLLISAAFIAFVQVPDFYVPAWMVVLIIGREFLITGLRTLAVSSGRIISAQPAGKFKTTSQIVAIITTLLIMVVNSFFHTFGGLAIEGFESRTHLWDVLLWIMDWGPYWMTFMVTVLTILSGYIYIRGNHDLFSERI